MSSRLGFRSKIGQKKIRYSKQGRKQLYVKKKKSQKIGEEINKLEEQYAQIDSSKIKTFEDFPLSGNTLKGLQSGKYSVPTDIQRESIGLALQGQDILGAAKTGSGKTLAFIVPVLECLFRNKWSQLDGLGALIISPTRELAYQTFEVLRKVGKFHDFSAGLVIGGKPLKEEAGRINRTNIVICTPGRLLQHMDETSNFTADSLKILVLDEADRILDMGFAQTMNAIIENLPSERQTLLFSATQTRSVKDLARLSLKEPMFVSVHEHAMVSTPVQLQQSYVVCELHEKLNLLWSFLKNHLKTKILVFLASCKEVKFVYEAFKKLQPGIPVLALHGGMSQMKRVAAYNQFLWKQNVVMFATDIASRGLDFPSVNWVVQLDCPEDASTYIHRVGRTARYEKDGEALLVLLPSEEEGMTEQLKAKKIPIDKIQINQKRLWSIQGKMESNCAARPELKEMAQKAFVTYLRSVFLMGNKKVFNIQALDLEKYSRSLGLALPPKVRFLKKRIKEMEMQAKKAKTEKLKKSQPEKGAKKEEKARSLSDNENNTDLDKFTTDRHKIDKGSSKNKTKEMLKSKLAKDVKQLMAVGDLENSSGSGEEKSSDDRDSESDSNNLIAKTKQSKTKHVKQLKAIGDSENSSGSSEEISSEESDSENDSNNRVVKNMKKMKKNIELERESESESSESSGSSELALNTKEVQDNSRRVNEKCDQINRHNVKSLKSKLHESDSEDSDSESESESDESDSEFREIKGKASQDGFNFDIDDDQELFSVKRNVDLKDYDKAIEDPVDNVIEKMNKKAKPLTKYAVAKKLKRMQLQVNTKVVFDEEGEALIDKLKAPAVGIDTERIGEVGGIDIEKARQKMRQEDKIDREIYRQKIRQKHREERLKKREENKLKKRRNFEEEEEAILDNTGDDGGADPLAFIPDPDEVYGKSQDSDFDQPPPKKKKKTQRKSAKGQPRDTEDFDSFSHTNTSLADDEDLALRLLNS